jgi:peptidoglycan hydrolase-like protein with peptidoglycan-binding domain
MSRRRITIAGVATVAAGVVVVAVVALGGDNGGPPPAAASTGATASVERRSLVDRDTVDGTLGYADASTLVAGVSGVLTGMRDPGSVVTRGHSLYEVDGAPAAFLLYGELPAWRDLASGISDGEDVRQLERNLRALGHDPDHDMAIDDHWDWATTAAVKRFQRARGLDETGTLSRGRVVFRPGATRIGEAKAQVGQQLAPGAALADVSSIDRDVTVDLDARRQSIAREGDTVTVDLPTGASARGRITDVGKVATKPSGRDNEDADPTIEVTIDLEGRAGRGTNLDQAPVDVGFAVDRRTSVLAVPVKALLARQGGGYAVEAVEGGVHRIVPVEPGLYAEDWVEVSGAGLREGMKVVTAQ